MQPHARKLIQAITLLQVRLERVKRGGPLRFVEGLGSTLAQDPGDGVAGMAGALGDLSLRHSLSVKFFDVHPLLRIDHGGRPPPSSCKTGKTPKALLKAAAVQAAAARFDSGRLSFSRGETALF